MSSKAKLTVCIPCFNEERYIKEVIESLLSQTFKDFVLQVVDDCSTDDTLGIVRRFKDPRVEVHRNRRNLGLYQNQNRCLELAKTQFVKILCADDLLAPTCLEKEVAVLERNPSVALVFTASLVIDAKGKRILARRLYPQSRRIKGRELTRVILIGARNPIGEPSGTLFRRSVIKKHKLRFRTDEFSHMADLDFWIQLLRHGDGYYIDKRLFSFRLHKSAGTVELLRRSVAEHRQLLSKYERSYSFSAMERAVFSLKLYFYFFGKMAFIRLFAR